MRDGKKCTAVVLAAGSGKRMGTNTPKQFLEINGKPILYYCLEAFENSFIDEIVLVCRKDDKNYLLTEIVNKYSFEKVVNIVEGGKERYHSVAAGLEATGSCDFVFIHDGARPFVTKEILDSSFEAVCRYGAVVAAVPSKDTVKLADEDGFVTDTPRRDMVYCMQTPQTFDYNKIKKCYEMLMEKENEIIGMGISITDDAMVMEHFGDERVFLSKGDYRNIKITTPEDLQIARIYVEEFGL